jgi:prophage regulatory protein
MSKNLRPRQAAEKLSIGLSTFWLKAKVDPEFPPLIRIAPRVCVVREADLDAYMDKKAAASLASRPNATTAQRFRDEAPRAAERNQARFVGGEQ